MSTPRRAFTMLELQVTLIVFAIGLLGIAGLMIRQSRQVSRMEQWCRSGPTYYVTSQTDPWMLKLGAAAALDTKPGGAAWTPPVSGTQRFGVQLNTFARSLDGQTLTADVKLK